MWHCDRDGEYSLYGQGITEQNYLRGVQVADQDGRVSFTSIFPACYSGRWPHIHFEVFDSLESAVAGEDARLTSQIALPTGRVHRGLRLRHRIREQCPQPVEGLPGLGQRVR